MKTKAILLKEDSAVNKSAKSKQIENSYSTKFKIVFEMKKWRNCAFY